MHAPLRVPRFSSSVELLPSTLSASSRWLSNGMIVWRRESGRLRQHQSANDRLLFHFHVHVVLWEHVHVVRARRVPKWSLVLLLLLCVSWDVTRFHHSWTLAAHCHYYYLMFIVYFTYGMS